MLVLDRLDDSTIERAGALVAREHVAARQVRAELPAGFDDAEACVAALQRLLRGGHNGLVASDNGRVVAVVATTVRENAAVGRYVRLPAEGFAVAPEVDDPTGLLGVVFGELASPLVVDGVRRYYLLHTALPRLAEALSNLGFGRDGVYGVQRSAPRRSSSVVAVRVAGVEDLESIARLAVVEIQHRSAAPMFAPRHDPPLSDVVEEHHALHDAGAVHLVAALDGRDVGLLTVELTSPVPRLCPDGQPYIGPTVTLPDMRGRGVGRSLVDAALNWTYSHGYQWISVDFASANPLSRPFWLNAGFRPTGYGVFRLIDSGIDGPPP